MTESGCFEAADLIPNHAAGGPNGEAGSGGRLMSGKNKKLGRSRAKVHEQRERLEQLCKPVVRRHIMKDLTKVGDVSQWRLTVDSMSLTRHNARHV